MKVLVTNGNSRMALCIIRELKKKRHEVIVADHVKNSMCFFSNKVDKKFIYPSPYSKPEHFIEKIKEQVISLNIDSIIPVHEETFLISKNKNALKSIVYLSVPDYEAILKVHNKDILYKLLQSHSICTPKTIALNEFKNFNEIRDKFSGRIVLKPRQGGGNWGIFLLDIKNGYMAQIENYLKLTKIDPLRVLVQEWIPIKEKFSHVVIYQNGLFIQDFADRHLRDVPLSGGAGVLRRSCNPLQMTPISKKLFDAIGWHGIAEVEYVTHAETGEFYLIEINPRIWGGINSAIFSDLDVVGMLIDISKGKKVHPTPYTIGKQTRWFWGDMRVFPEYYEKSDNKLTVITEFIKLFFDKTKTDEFYWDDPLPFFLWPAHSIYKMFKYRSFKPVTYDSLAGEWE